MTTRNFNRQMWTVQSLELPPTYGNYEMRRFEVYEVGTSVQVVREWYRTDLNNFGYHESRIVGPRGGSRYVRTSTLYS
jgi:hypothetical protein